MAKRIERGIERLMIRVALKLWSTSSITRIVSNSPLMAADITVS
jgi:hypothetical protein